MTIAKLHTNIAGPEDAPVLMLLNSFGATNAMWDAQMGLLSGHYRVIRCDTRGHGDSPTPPAPYSFDDLVSDAFGVLDSYGVEKASVMGLSLGGMTALGMGLAVPERIERLVCCAARADAPEPFVQNWVNRMGMLDEGGIELVWNNTVGMWLSDSTRNDQPDVEAALRRSFLKTTDAGYLGCANALMGLDYLKHLDGMTVPTLYVAGENDAAAPPAVMQAMADATPGSEFVTVPDSKHIINADNPSNFAVALLDFLNLEHG